MPNQQDTDAFQTLQSQITTALRPYPEIELVIVFGSVARSSARPDSDLDIGMQARQPLSANRRLSVIDTLARAMGRPVDLIDLRQAGEPLLGEILTTGRRVLGTDSVYARLLTRHLFDQADFLPYRQRILSERRLAWIGA